MYSLTINSPSKWLTAEGEVMQIKNMETSHIRNCIRLIEQGKIKCQAHKLPVLRTELQKRLR